MVASPVPGKCSYYVVSKRRHCKFAAVPGKEYCGNHLPMSDGGRRRVPCPWDPLHAHDIFEGDVERHKKTCPAYLAMLKQQAANWFKLDCNVVTCANRGQHTSAREACSSPRKDSSTQESPSLAASRAVAACNLGEDAFGALLHRIEVAWKQHCAALDLQYCPASGVSLSKDDDRPFSLKHAQQQASIVGNMERVGMLRNASQKAFVEFGAGRGYLSCALADCAPNLEKLVLVDIRGFKLKADRCDCYYASLAAHLPSLISKTHDHNIACRSLRHLALERLRCNLKDFCVGGTAALAAKENQEWVGYGKHLCGAATDFALVASLQTAPSVLPAKGIAIATCCHHRCTWNTYVGQSFFTGAGFTGDEFELISWMTGTLLISWLGAVQPSLVHSLRDLHSRRLAESLPGWALCGHETAPGCVEGGEEEMPEERKDAVAYDPGQPWRPDFSLARSQRMALGRKCKDLIDVGRHRWLECHEYETESVLYIDALVSGENCLLLASR